MTYDLDKVEFTYYGDLLGIANLYAIESKLAKDTLDTFYNSTFEIFQDIAKEEIIEVFLFSDSIFITGTKIETIIKKLCTLYNRLFFGNIFLRGAIVKGKLDFDPRLEFRNFQKRLPSTDVLFRAVTLEKSVNGMRLLLEKDLTKDTLLPAKWLTDDLYEKNIKLQQYNKDDFRRGIVLSAEWHCYEYLWPCHFGPKGLRTGEDFPDLVFRQVGPKDRLINERLISVPKPIRRHLEATREIFQRSSHRYRITQDVLP